VTAKDGQTGVGKSNVTDFLAWVCDTSVTGFTPEKTTIDPPQFLRLYDELAPGSSAVLEEGGQLDARRAMSNENVDTTHKWQMARVREITAFINLPSPDDIDSRLERLADYWVNVQRRGLARIYKKKIHPIKRTLYYETLQDVEWPNMDKSRTFKQMGRQKAAMLADDDRGDNWVRESDVQDRIETAVESAERDLRDRWITAVYRRTGLTGNDVANLMPIEIGAARVREIANE
jgi:hypothetical protein